jgi:hypothetical protein
MHGNAKSLTKACKELLFEPITLPCGYSICHRCFRLPKSCLEEENNQSFQVNAYKCPIKICSKLHQYRKEKQNYLLHELLLQLFPIQQQALRLSKEGEERLAKYWNPRHNGINRNESSDQIAEKHKALAQILSEYFDRAIDLDPYLQLPYVLRCKAYVELGRFDDAIADAVIANKVNENNRRGEACVKIVQWRKAMHHSQNDTLADRALEALRSTDTFADASIAPSLQDMDLAETVKDAAVELRSELVEIMNQTDSNQFSSSFSRLVETCQEVNSSYLECQICLGRYSDPVTCPCGHSWCRSCLFDTHTQNKECPMCRTPMPSIGYFLKRPADYSLSAILSYESSFSCSNSSCDDGNDFLEPFTIPLFVCSLVVPNAKEGFHMFEPRYRVRSIFLNSFRFW